MSNFEKESNVKVRRSDRSVTDSEWIINFLENAPYATIATSDKDQPVININTFVYDRQTDAIYFHTAKRGKFRSNIEENDKICFSVASMGRLLPADVAREFSVEYSSVVLYGNIEIMTDMDLARDKMQLLLNKYFPRFKPEEHYRSITSAEVQEISVFKISIDKWSAKQKEAPNDFKDAFYFDNRYNI